MKARDLIIIVAIIALGIGIAARFLMLPAKYAPPKPAVEFNLPDLAGKVHSNKEWQGKIQIINFWATWCAPCRKEIPEFIKLQTRYAANNVQFIGIAIDDAPAVQEFLTTIPSNYPMLIGGDSAAKLAKQYGSNMGALPYTVVINQQGQVVHQQLGEFATDDLIKVITPLLKI